MNDQEVQYEKESRRRSKLTEKIEEHLNEGSCFDADDDLGSKVEFNVFISTNLDDP
jgi:hypothetical protein